MKREGILYLSRSDVESVQLSMAEIIDALEETFREKGAGRTEMPPKPGIHPRPDAFIHAMPAYVPALEAAGLKWVSGYPQNQAQGLPYIHGLIILNDPDTGVPISVMDASWITAMRTGAATAVAARRLARANSLTVGVVACGVQGRTNLEALLCVCPLQQVNAYDIVPDVAERFAREMGQRFGIQIQPVETLFEAVDDLDIVVTSCPILKRPSAPIGPGHLKPGAFASAVDFDSSWQGSALRAVTRLATDDIAQMEYYRREGYFQDTPQPYADLGDLVAGRKPGRESDEEITMAMNLGIALEDMATAALIYQRAVDRGLGVMLAP